MRTPRRIPMVALAQHPYPVGMNAMPLDVELDAYAQAVREVVQLLATDEHRLSTVAPQVSGWSALHHAAHMTLANELILRNLASLSKGAGLLVVFEAAQKPEALAFLAAGRLPRGRAQSPRMVVPPSDIDASRAREWAAQVITDLDALIPTLHQQSPTRCFIPHQMLGPLDLAQWLRFGIVHTRHHLTIAREVLA
jgi:hypothetical protein